MADDTFRTKGAIEPDSSFSSSSDNTFRWKGAVEPAVALVVGITSYAPVTTIRRRDISRTLRFSEPLDTYPTTPTGSYQLWWVWDIYISEYRR